MGKKGYFLCGCQGACPSFKEPEGAIPFHGEGAWIPFIKERMSMG